MQYKNLSEIAFINPDSIKKDYPYNEIEYIDISSVGTGNLLETKTMLLSEASSRAKRLVKDKDTILSTVRPNRRSFLFIRKPKDNIVVSTGFAVLRAKNGTDPQYLYYAITHKKFTDYLTISAKGAAYPAVDAEIIQRGKVPYWPPEVQRKISVILSTYDDLIENNTRRIQILEEMAQKIYREWFVDFRFPGYERKRLIGSKLGKIPQGWELAPFTDFIDVLSGGTPKTITEEYWGGDIPFFTPKDARDNFYVIDTEKRVTELGLSKCNSRLYPKNTVFITARGTVGKVVLASQGTAMNQSCYALVGHKGIGQYYVFLTIKKQVEYLKQHTGGATFDTIIVDTFRRMKVIRPPLKLIEKFEEMITPFFKEIFVLTNKNQLLKESRDIFLPKLISGEMDVSGKDIVMRNKNI